MAFDISDVLLAIPEGLEVYLDESHVNLVANELIARCISETVWEADGEGDAGPN